MEPTTSRSSSSSSWKRVAQVAVPIIVVLAIVVVALVARSGDDDDPVANEAGEERERASTDELIESGPMTPQKAELEGVDVDFGPACDTETGRVAIPSNYAPPCVEPFSGDNGGATNRGVTGDQITVVAYEADPAFSSIATSLTADAGVDTDPGAGFATAQRWAELYNDLFEQYGRSVELVRYVGRGAPEDVEQAKADAIDIAETYEPFAVIGGPSLTGAFAEELVAREIVCIGSCAGAPSESDIVEQVPYRWPVGLSTEQFARLTGEFVGTSLAGRPAEFAGDAQLQDEDRVFGALYFQTPGEPNEAFDALRDELSTYDVELAAEVPFELDLTRIQEIARTSITKLKEAGITSVIIASDPFSPLSFTQEATAQEWFPEWVIGPNVAVDLNLAGRRYDQEQWAHAFGLTQLGVRTTDAAGKPFDLYEWYFGEEPPSNASGAINLDVGLLFGGIHLAGPELTPDAFADGLFRGPRQDGSMITPLVTRGRNGLWPGYDEDFVDYFGTDDVALIWWDAEIDGEDELDAVGQGLYQFADEGARYSQGELPESPRLFDPDTSIAILEDIPSDIAPATQPSPADGP